MTVTTLHAQTATLQTAKNEGPFKNCKVALLTAPNSFTPETTVSQLTFADFAGYSEKTNVNFNGPYYDPSGRTTLSAPSQTWICTATSTPNVIVGFVILSESGNVLALSQVEETPILKAGDGITVQPSLSWGD